ncbi:hypothetical protein CHU92_08315 [Flavobacterium cyanobacteriorum]|uniref:Uncharacterized protein n=1 Tax=Flavobacterium cyanobacteriorum TaxID=2022802 RepID=A0A255Z7S4_9FLAO|nr:hypothetical protein [Flavobacterium cyanobacteriorum]OYQ37472.1 hypothetical protein CHU92_08315 [Flavobacterium cyanobacteriorum]
MTDNIVNTKRVIDYDPAILDDSTFKDYLYAEYYALEKLKTEDIVRFKDSKITENNTDEVINALGFESRGKYIEFAKKQFERYTYLENKYKISSLTEETKYSLVKDGLIKFQIPVLHPDPVEVPTMSCTWKKRWCDVGVIGAAVLAHTACGALDVETLGLTIILGCHTGAALAQAAGHALCIANYDDCVAGK